MRASVPSQFAMPSASPSDRSEVRARRPRQRDETNASIAFCSLASRSKILLRTVSPSPPCCSAASRRLAARPVAAARADRDPSAGCMRPVAKRRAKSLIHRHERALRTESASGLGLQQELQFRRQGAAAAKSADLPTCRPADLPTCRTPQARSMPVTTRRVRSAQWPRRERWRVGACKVRVGTAGVGAGQSPAAIAGANATARAAWARVMLIPCFVFTRQAVRDPSRKADISMPPGPRHAVYDQRVQTAWCRLPGKPLDHERLGHSHSGHCRIVRATGCPEREVGDAVLG